MTWTKLDDGFWMHPKVIAAGNTGAGLYARMLSYCGFYLSDGQVPASIVETITGRDRAGLDRLVQSGLVERSEDGSITIPDWLDFNPSREEIQAKRRKDSERKSQRRRPDSARIPRGRDADASGSPSSLARGGPQAYPDPTRPDHFPPDPPRPVGGRQRDGVKYEKAKAEARTAQDEFARAHFPSADPDGIRNAAAFLLARRVEPTVEAIRALLDGERAA